MVSNTPTKCYRLSLVRDITLIEIYASIYPYVCSFLVQDSPAQEAIHDSLRQKGWQRLLMGGGTAVSYSKDGFLCKAGKTTNTSCCHVARKSRQTGVKAPHSKPDGHWAQHHGHSDQAWKVHRVYSTGPRIFAGTESSLGILVYVICPC